MNSSKTDIQLVKPTILIVEDHEAVRASLRNMLQASFADCRFLEAETGEEAIAMVRSHRPEIVVIDIGLPKMSGIEATRHIKAEVEKAKVVVVSIHEALEYRADADAAGASAFVLKSEIPSKLIPVIAKLLSEFSDQTSDD